MEPTERLRAWTYRRQCLDEGALTPAKALAAVVAVYATHPTSPLALWARTPAFSPAKYRRIDRSGAGVRIPAMRRTVFLVPTRNAARIFSAVRSSEAHALRPLKRAGISTEEYGRYARRVMKAKEPLTARELEDVVGVKGRELGVVLRCLRYEGRVLTLAGDSLNMTPHRYIATASWVPDGLEHPDIDKARGWLAGEYLRAYGPARVEDFRWWTGLPKKAAEEAITTLDTIDVGGGNLLLGADEAAFAKVKRVRNAVKLLPKWDAYTMAHAPDGRSRFVHPDVQAHVYTPIGIGLSGDGNPVILVDGEVVGLWTFSQKEGPKVLPFDPLGTRTRNLVDAQLDEIAGLLA